MIKLLHIKNFIQCINTKFIMININGHQFLLVSKILVLPIIWTTQKTWHKCTNTSLSPHILASNSIYHIALLGLNI